MTSIANLINQLTMGCMCTKETVVAGDRRYYVRSRLGEGGFSYVDLVEESRTRRLYALKRISCHSKEDEQLALKEIEYMNSLEHPNLIPCEGYTVVPTSGHRSVICEVLIIMPFYTKGSVWDELEFLTKTSDYMKEQRVIHLFQGVCDGVRALHYHKPTPFSHRDIKPHNVMLEVDDTPVLMDFGSMGPAKVEIKGAPAARAMQDLAAERCSMPYRAPELFNVESYCTIDEKIDIWSLGCTLYSMCYRESPFDKAYQRGDSIALAVLGENIKLPDVSIYSQGLKDLILSMLMVNPAERPDIDWVITKVEALRNAQENRI